MVGDLDVAGFIVRVQKKADQTRKPFLVPPLVLYAVFVLAAFAQGIQISFTDWTGLTPGFHYVGLDNYLSLVQYSDWWRALEHNPILLIVVPVITLTLALLFASLLTRGGSGGARDGLPGSRFYRVLFFFPQVVPVVIVGIMFGYVYSTQSGLLQAALTTVGIDMLTVIPNGPLGNPATIIFAIALATGLVGGRLLHGPWCGRFWSPPRCCGWIVVSGGVTLTLLLSAMAAYVLARYPFFGSRGIYLRLSHRADVPPLLSDRPAHEGRAEPASVREQARPDPDLCGVLVAVLGVLPDGFLPVAAQGTRRGRVHRRRRPLRHVLRDHAAAGQARPDLDRRLQLPRPMEPIPAAARAEPAGRRTAVELPAHPGAGLADLALRTNYETSANSVAQMFAGLVISMLPVLIVYVVFQRRVEEGLTAGALK